jgi:ankyrin repeat protein
MMGILVQSSLMYASTHAPQFKISALEEALQIVSSAPEKKARLQELITEYPGILERPYHFTRKTLLCSAILSDVCDEDVALSLITATNKDLRDENNNTPLILAGRKKKIKIIERLLEMEANINAQEPGYNDTVLHEAAAWGHIEVIKILLQHNPDMNIKNKYNLTPYEYAKKLEEVQTLFPQDKQPAQSPPDAPEPPPSTKESFFSLDSFSLNKNLISGSLVAAGITSLTYEAWFNFNTQTKKQDKTQQNSYIQKVQKSPNKHKSLFAGLALLSAGIAYHIAG